MRSLCMNVLRNARFLITALCVTTVASIAQAGMTDPSADLVLGQVDFTHNGPNIVKGDRCSDPYGVAIDTTTSRIYVCDTGNNRVLWWNNSDSLANGQHADGVLGQESFSTMAPACSATGMNAPQAISVDGAGNVWVADSNNNRVLKFNKPLLATGETADIVLGQTDFTSKATACSQTGLSYPIGVSADRAGNVWVADYSNCRALKFNAPTEATGEAADIVLGQLDFTSGISRLTRAGMSNPHGVCADGEGNVWVVDHFQNRVLKFSTPTLATGEQAALVLGQPDFTAMFQACTPTGMDAPHGVSVDDAGNVWVTDEDNRRVLKFIAPLLETGETADIVLGQATFTSLVYACTQTGMTVPRGVAVDASGNPWVVDGNRVMKFNMPTLATGETADIVIGQQDFTHTTNNYIQGNGLSTPFGIAIDTTSGRIYASDTFNNRVLWWNTATALADGQSADGVIGQPDFTSNTAACTQTGMDNPFAVNVDGAGNVWVADSNNNRVLKFNKPTLATGETADIVLGQPDFATNGAATTPAKMYAPYGVCVDGPGNVWVADTSNNRVLKFNTPSAATGEAADIVIGQPDFTSNGPACAQTGIAGATGVTIDSSGNAWVADQGNARVLKFTAPALVTGEAADIVLGQTDFTSNTGDTTQTVMFGPWGVSLDGEGNVWAADFNSHRVLRFNTPALATGEAADFVLGQENFTSWVPACTQTGMSWPCGVCVDGAGNVWVADSNNNRVLKFNALCSISITPNTAPNSGLINITNLSGQSFSAGANVTLTKAGESDIEAAAVTVAETDKITCSFDLLGKPTGYWNVVVSTGGEGSARTTLANGFLITAATTKTNQVDPSTKAQIEINPASGKITVTIEPGTFGQTATVTVSTAAVPASTRVSILKGSICITVSNNLNLQPGRDITLTVHYRDADIAGLDESKIVLCRYDAAHDLWIPLPTAVDSARNVLTATTNHLSVFVLVQLTAAADLAQVKAYPAPYNPARGHMKIDNLTPAAEIKIFTIAGDLVRTVDYMSENGRATWDGKNDGGSTVASGVYIMCIESPSHKHRLKIAVEK